MREYRAFDKERNEYLAAGKVLISIHRGKDPINKIWLDILRNPDIYKDRFILQQYIGKADITNKRIFKGDIITGTLFIDLPTMGEIIYDNELTSYCNKNEGGVTLLHHISEIKIIGNICENKELLK